MLVLFVFGSFKNELYINLYIGFIVIWSVGERAIANNDIINSRV